MDPSIEQGLEISNRLKSDFKTCSIITCAISDDIDRARRAAKGTIAFYATVRTYEPPFKLHGFSEQAKKIRECYFNKDISGMIDNVTEDMVDTFAVVGDESYCLQKIEEYNILLDLPILSVPHYFIDFEEVKEYQRSLIRTFGT